MKWAMDLEQRLERESHLIELANAWVGQTGGEIAPGVVITAEQYMERIQQLPLWERVKDDLSLYVPLMNPYKAAKVKDKKIHINSYMLRSALRVFYILEHFLTDPDYSQGDPKNVFGSPKKLISVLRDYITDANNDQGEYEYSKGNGVLVYYAIKGSTISEEQLLKELGLYKQWKVYQSTVGLPRDCRKAARETIEHFLDNPDYSIGTSHKKFGEPFNLTSVLSSYNKNLNKGKGGFETGKGSLQFLYNPLLKNYLTEEHVLDSIGLQERWKLYQKSRGIPLEYRDLALIVIDDFLFKAPNEPKTLKYVLRHYHPKIGRVIFNASKIRQAIDLGKFTEKQLLESIGILDQWQAYQKSTISNPFIYTPNNPIKS